MATLTRRHQAAIERQIRIWPDQDFAAFLRYVGPMDPEVFEVPLVTAWLAEKGGVGDNLVSILKKHWSQAERFR